MAGISPLLSPCSCSKEAHASRTSCRLQEVCRAGQLVKAHQELCHGDNTPQQQVVCVAEIASCQAVVCQVGQEGGGCAALRQQA